MGILKKIFKSLSGASSKTHSSENSIECEDSDNSIECEDSNNSIECEDSMNSIECEDEPERCPSIDSDNRVNDQIRSVSHSFMFLISNIISSLLFPKRK